MSIKALKLDADGAINVIDMHGDSTRELLADAEMIVKGRIAAIRLKDEGLMIVACDGDKKAYLHNSIASILSKKHVFGSALIVREEDGNLMDVPEKFLALLEIGEV